MTLYLGENLIAGSFKTGASWEVGDVGISAFGIDEALNKRRYLNGQVISQAQFVEFTAFLKSRVSVYPSLATTEVNWQAAVTNSALGQCGKFVIDDNAGTIRLPKVVNINGLQDLTGLGEIKEAGLPNITGTYSPNVNVTAFREDGIASGAFKKSSETYSGNYGVGFANVGTSSRYLELDASLSNSIYGNSTTVQQEAVQYPYFIQVAEGVESTVDVSREIELNNPFSLLDYKFSEYELSNASWLLSNGQYNSGVTYSAVYNLLLQIYNGTETKAGVSVKLSTEAYTDTDFVLNTNDTTFRLPTVVKLASGKAVAGNGMTLGLTDGTNNAGLRGNFNLTRNALDFSASGYGKNVGVADNETGTGLTDDKMYGITTDPTKSGIETSANGLYLYFYVGDTVQDANIIAAAGVLTRISELSDSNIAGMGMPSSRYIDLTLGASGSTYTAPANGWFSCSSEGVVNIVLSNQEFSLTITGASGYAPCGFIPVRKGELFAFTYSSNQNNKIRFYYAEGDE